MEVGDEVVVSGPHDHVARLHVPSHVGLQHQHDLHRYCARASLITDDEGGRRWDGHRDEVVVVSAQQGHVARLHVRWAPTSTPPSQLLCTCISHN